MADGFAPIVIPAPISPVAQDEVDIVLFAGAGGADEGIRRAFGKEPGGAVNHWMDAVLVHQVNFPESEHHCADVMETDPDAVCTGKPVRLLWLSPDCRHFSPAKGSAPVSKSIRALAWAAIPWAVKRRPRVFVLENVEAFLTWGPVITGEHGKQHPDPAKKGRTFERWKSRLEQLGYVIDWRILSAADLGVPTIRKRLFLIARCDGGPMDFPVATHASRRVAKTKGLAPHRAAADCIDFARPCPSIFLTSEEAKVLRVKRPLKEATLARIAKGLFRYTIDNADPFIVGVTHAGDDRTRDIREPLATVTGANRGEFAVVAPTMIRTDMTGARFAGANDPLDPLRTFTGAGGLAIASAYLVPRYGEREGQEPRALSVEEPLPTIVGTGNGGQLVATTMIGLAHGDNWRGAGGRAHSPEEPLRTIHAQGGNHALLAAYIELANTRSVGSDLAEPLGAPTSHTHHGVVAAFMEQANTGMVGHDARSPVSTIVGRGTTQRLVTAQLSQMRGSSRGIGDLTEPVRTLTAGGGRQALLQATLEGDRPMATPFGREPELRAFLVKYYGAATAQDLADPLGTVTSRSRFGLVMVKGVAYRIIDIGMRMLDPETELARAMGLRPGFVLNRDAAGRKVTKTKITKMVGNMVCPDVAEAIVRCLFPVETKGTARG